MNEVNPVQGATALIIGLGFYILAARRTMPSTFKAWMDYTLAFFSVGAVLFMVGQQTHNKVIEVPAAFVTFIGMITLVSLAIAYVFHEE